MHKKNGGDGCRGCAAPHGERVPVGQNGVLIGRCLSADGNGPRNDGQQQRRPNDQPHGSVTAGSFQRRLCLGEERRGLIRAARRGEQTGQFQIRMHIVGLARDHCLEVRFNPG